jgi:glycosyltransferase involved in cell wall biosynthesis
MSDRPTDARTDAPAAAPAEAPADVSVDAPAAAPAEAAAPAVSIIMPAHDAAAYIADAIESILAQTFADLELIVVNDSSTDHTQEVIDAYAARDPRVRPLRASVRSAARARNVALEAARGEFVALMDADDVALPDRIEKQVEAARDRPDVVLWGTYMRRITAEGVPMGTVEVGSRTTEEFDALDRTASLIRLYGTVALFRRETLLRVGPFDPTFEPIEDAELWDRMASHGPALVVPEVLQLYRQHDESLSVRKIALQRKWYRFITRRHAERLAGRTFTIDDFERAEGRRTRLHRLDDRLRGVSQLHGRRYKIALARRAYAQALTSALMMVLTHPGRFFRRLGPRAPHL